MNAGCPITVKIPQQPDDSTSAQHIIPRLPASRRNAMPEAASNAPRESRRAPRGSSRRFRLSRCLVFLPQIQRWYPAQSG